MKIIVTWRWSYPSLMQCCVQSIGFAFDCRIAELATTKTIPQDDNNSEKQRNLPYRPVSSLRSPRTISCFSIWVASSRPLTNSSKTWPEVGTERFASICARNSIRDSFIPRSSPRKSWTLARFKRRKPATVIQIFNDSNRENDWERTSHSARRSTVQRLTDPSSWCRCSSCQNHTESSTFFTK